MKWVLRQIIVRPDHVSKHVCNFKPLVKLLKLSIYAFSVVLKYDDSSLRNKDLHLHAVYYSTILCFTRNSLNIFESKAYFVLELIALKFLFIKNLLLSSYQIVNVMLSSTQNKHYSESTSMSTNIQLYLRLLSSVFKFYSSQLFFLREYCLFQKPEFCV